MQSKYFLSLLLLASLAVTAKSQEEAEAKQAYDLRVVEIPTTKEIQDQLLESGAANINLAMKNAEWREMTSCTLLLDQRTKVMFGKTVALVSGVTNSGRGTMRSMRQQSLGTAVSAVLSAEGDELSLQLSYQASRLGSPQQEDALSPPIEQTVFDSTVVLELSEPKIVTTTPHSCLIVTLQKERKLDRRRSRN